MLRYLTLLVIFSTGSIIANSIEPSGILHDIICLLAGALGAFAYTLFDKK